MKNGRIIAVFGVRRKIKIKLNRKKSLFSPICTLYQDLGMIYKRNTGSIITALFLLNSTYEFKKHLGHTARKRFGQNFLHDTSVIQGIVAAIYPQPNQFLVEIGPGLGALTEPVGELVDHLTVVELDRDLAERLRHHPFLHQKLTVIETDAMQFDFGELYRQENLAEKGQKITRVW